MKRKIKIEDLKFDLGNLINLKATLETEIDREQKWLSENHLQLGSNQMAVFTEKIQSLQLEYKSTLHKITKLKIVINDYETKRN